MIRNIIFDWSGTLVDDLPAVWRASNHVFLRAGVEALTLERFRAEFSLPFKHFYERFTPHVPLSDLEAWYYDHFNQIQDSVCELPHAREFLLFCQGHCVRTFLLSTIHRDHFAAQSACNGFDRLLERPYVEVRDKCARIQEILAENQLVPAETLFIGDMQHDMDAARCGGIHSCAVLTGYNSSEQLRASDPELIVEHLGELQERLRRSEFRWETAIGHG